MDIADDNLTLPLPSPLIKRQLQRGVGFMVNDQDTDDEEDMDVTAVIGGIIPSRDGVGRLLTGEGFGADEDDQTMEFTRIYPRNLDPTLLNVMPGEDDTVDMDLTRIVTAEDLRRDTHDENVPPQGVSPDADDTLPMDFTRIFSKIQTTPQKPSVQDDDRTQEMDFTRILTPLKFLSNKENFPPSTHTPANQTPFTNLSRRK